METRTTIVDVEVDGHPMAVFVACPTGPAGTRYPAIVVAYEAFGMTEYIQNVATTLAADGYVVGVPDLYHRQGRLLSVGYGEYSHAAQADRSTPLDSRRLMFAIDDAGTIRDLEAALDYLRGQPEARAEAPGALGFWNGGRLAYLLAGDRPDIKALVSFYGHIVADEVTDKRPVSPIDVTPRVNAAVLLLWGKDGQPQTLPQVKMLEERLTREGKQFESKMYDVPRGFHNPNVLMYDATAADDAWQRARDWFKKYLSDAR